MAYDYSYFSVLDGRNGDTLWSLNCSQAVMSSPLTLLSKVKGEDAMMFIGIGCGKMNALSEIDNDQEEKKGGEGGGRGEEGRGEGKRKRYLVCPRKHFETEFGRTECDGHETHERIMRHESEGFFPSNSESSGQDEHVTAPPQENTIDIDFSKYLPDDLWESQDSSDMFPDPWEQSEYFIKDYCGYDPELMEASLYFLTPQLLKTSAALPIISFRPYVYS